MLFWCLPPSFMPLIGNDRNRVMPRESFAGFGGEHHVGVDNHKRQSWLTPYQHKHWIMNTMTCTMQCQTQIVRGEGAPWQLEQQDVRKGACYRSDYSCPLPTGLFKVKANWNVHKKWEESSWPKHCVPGTCWSDITLPWALELQHLRIWPGIFIIFSSKLNLV